MRGLQTAGRVARRAATAAGAAGIGAAVTAGLLAGAAPAAAETGVPAVPAATVSAAAGAHGLGALAPRTVVRAGTATGLRAAGATAGRPAALPARVDLRADAPTPGNQGAVNSCVAWAVDYTLLGWWAHRTHQAGAPFAPMFAYSQVAGGRDTGSYPYDVLNLTLAEGADTAADYTQGGYDYRTQPTAVERANAAHHAISDYAVVFSGAGQGAAVRTALETALVAHGPATLTIPVDGAFQRLHAGAATYTGLTGRVLGGHEVVVVGYDSTGVTIENSWGTAWGQGGFAHLSWSFVQRSAWDSYVVTGLASRSLPVPAVRAVTSASGPTAGWVATVTGSGFTAGSVVRVGTRTASVVRVTGPTSLQVRLPAAAAGTAAVTVLTTGIASPPSAGARVTYRA